MILYVIIIVITSGGWLIKGARAPQAGKGSAARPTKNISSIINVFAAFYFLSI